MKDERSIPDVLRDVASNIQTLVRCELRLFETEIHDKVARASGPGATFAGGVAVASYAFGFLLLAAMFGLSRVMPLWVSALVVGAVLAITAGILIGIGKKGLQDIDPIPNKTIRSLEASAQWANEQIK
jgi:hypothetical protein